MTQGTDPDAPPITAQEAFDISEWGNSKTEDERMNEVSEKALGVSVYEAGVSGHHNVRGVSTAFLTAFPESVNWPEERAEQAYLKFCAEASEAAAGAPIPRGRETRAGALGAANRLINTDEYRKGGATNPVVLEVRRLLRIAHD